MTSSAVISVTTVNTATWTAFNPNNRIDELMATDTATVNVIVPETLACNGSPVTFDVAGIPSTWSVTNDGTGAAPATWTSTADTNNCGIANLTNGSGTAACADSDNAGSGGGAYDTSLVSNPFNIMAGQVATLTAAAYYRDVNTGSNDTFEVDIWDGATWNNLLLWDEDHEPEDIAVSLNAYSGTTGAQIRFRYQGDGFDWYAEVDDVSLSCGTQTAITLSDNVAIPSALSVIAPLSVVVLLMGSMMIVRRRNDFS
ncbi:MAG TPA: hypothetical protein ENJ56_01485 [Anaerolineae bacterium]|nr:hypothetical protein [Anaerolineae bacterium]